MNSTIYKQKNMWFGFSSAKSRLYYINLMRKLCDLVRREPRRGEARRPRQGTRPRLKEKLPEYYYTAS